MDLKLNKGFSIILTSLLLMINLFGLPIILMTFDILYPDNTYNLSLSCLVLANLSMTFANLSRLIIGFWLFLNAEKFDQDKWTWLLIGLVFGQYGLILFGILMIIQNVSSRIDLFKAVKPILILLIITFFLSPLYNLLLTPYLTRVLNMTDYGFITEYNSSLSYATYGIMILMNIVFAIKLGLWIKQLNMKNKSIWIISTIFLGLFPMILFNELIIIDKDNN